jgi:hypothetical protein
VSFGGEAVGIETTVVAVAVVVVALEGPSGLAGAQMTRSGITRAIGDIIIAVELEGVFVEPVTVATHGLRCGTRGLGSASVNQSVALAGQAERRCG